ncbi:hypothetical protein DB30_02544 [Enhygromyxa salina]|uniref:Uncharacterized protein n=1 Tax=Enhygromyxa salina TaxID=215803 RepID=A0A0C2CKN8_9BACT|nr:hypothetical protein [Enhygromyxa salina]KIG11766.1 hypothetical protein DB30_02544 [Enhygromyxa salina]
MREALRESNADHAPSEVVQQTLPERAHPDFTALWPHLREAAHAEAATPAPRCASAVGSRPTSSSGSLSASASGSPRNSAAWPSWPWTSSRHSPA